MARVRSAPKSGAFKAHPWRCQSLGSISHRLPKLGLSPWGRVLNGVLDIAAAKAGATALCPARRRDRFLTARAGQAARLLCAELGPTSRGGGFRRGHQPRRPASGLAPDAGTGAVAPVRHLRRQGPYLAAAMVAEQIGTDQPRQGCAAIDAPADDGAPPRQLASGRTRSKAAHAAGTAWH